MPTRTTIAVSFLILAAGGCASSRPLASSSPAIQTSPDLESYEKARLGLFVHWDPVSQVGTEISWSRQNAGKHEGIIPTTLYDNLYRYFNPAQFDADAFVAAAQAAGARYLVFTTKHHDGFCMFDSQWTHYKITNSPFKRDITAEIAAACHRAHMKLGFYYSPPDWHHPDFRTPNHRRYITYMHRQIRELCTRYGKVDVWWFDGLGGTEQDWDSTRLIAMIRELQPGIVVNNRAGLPADYDTPEQKVGTFQNDRPWESCITIGEQWSYKPHDKIKSTKELVRILVECACGDGNLLLNVGPKWNGLIEPDQVAQLRTLGDWLRQYGESIYATRGGPIAGFPWGGSTHREKRLYLHIWDWDESMISLPALKQKILSCRSLTGGEARLISNHGAYQIELKNLPDTPVTVVALDLDNPIDDKLVLAPVTMGKTATASNTFRGEDAFGPGKALDTSRSTRWATDEGQKTAWLEVNLGSEQTINTAFLSEEYDRVQAYEIQAWQAGSWKTVASGQTVGAHRQLRFEPVKAQRVRLNITQSSGGPTIRTFQLYMLP